jgi:hypothetical protein
MFKFNLPKKFKKYRISNQLVTIFFRFFLKNTLHSSILILHLHPHWQTTSVVLIKF